MSRTNGKATPKLPEQADRWPPPAFQWYAADALVSETFKLAGLAERGLLLSVLSYCWANETIPQEPARMAHLLGINVNDIERNWGDLIRAHLVPAPGDDGRLFDRDLERQKQRMAERRAKQARGGSKGGKTTQARIRKEKEGASQPSSQPSSFAKASEQNRKNRTEGFQGGAVSAVPDEKWVRDFDGEPQERAA